MGDRFTHLGVRRRSRTFEIADALDPAGRRVVLKRACALDELGKRRFLRETRLGCLLKSRGLAAVLDHGDGWIAFELLENALDTDTEGSDEAKVRRILQKAATTLVHLHASGVVHRDLKPAHIMFRGNEPVVIDLGVAGLVADDPLEGTEIVGSPAWMAPEQALGAPPAPAADIWSLCAIGHWLLSGRALYTGNADAVLAARRAGARCSVDLSDVRDQKLAEILAAGLGPAEDRPSAAEIVAVIDNGAVRHSITRSTAG